MKIKRTRERKPVARRSTEPAVERSEAPAPERIVRIPVENGSYIDAYRDRYDRVRFEFVSEYSHDPVHIIPVTPQSVILEMPVAPF